MKTSKQIVDTWYMEIKAAYEMRQAIVAREYDFDEIVLDINMSMYNDIIGTVGSDSGFAMTEYTAVMDDYMYQIASVLILKEYLKYGDILEIVDGIQGQMINKIEDIFDRYIKS